MPDNQTRTFVTVHPMSDEYPVRYDNALWRSDADGDLQLTRDGATFAIWARGTWQRAELTEEPVALHLTDSGYEPEEPAGPGTFEVYEDTAGKYRYRLKAHNGEVIASGQAYASRKGAHAGAAAVQRAAADAPIVDVDR